MPLPKTQPLDPIGRTWHTPRPMADSPHPGKRGWIPFLSVLAACGAWLLFVSVRRVFLDDDGNYLFYAREILAGKTPYVDFVQYNMMGCHYLWAALLSLGGPPILITRIAFVIIALIAYGAVYLSIRRLVAPLPSAIAAGMGIIATAPCWPQLSYYHLATTIGLVALAVVITGAPVPTRRRAVVIGLLCGLALDMKLNAGGTAMLAVLGALSARIVTAPPPAHRLRSLLCGTLNVVVASSSMVGLYVLLLWLRGTPPGILLDSVLTLARLGPGGFASSPPAPWSLIPEAIHPRAVYRALDAALYYLPLAAALMATAWGVSRRRRSEAGDSNGVLFALAAYAAVSVLHLWPRADRPHLANALHIPVALFALGATLWGPRVVRVSALLASVLLVVFLLLEQWRLYGRATQSLDGILEGIRVTPEEARDLRELREIVHRRCPPGAPVLVVGNAPLLYPWIDRPCPARLPLLDPIRPDVDLQIIRDGTPAALLRTRMRALPVNAEALEAQVDRAIGERYLSIDRRGGWEVLLRRD